MEQESVQYFTVAVESLKTSNEELMHLSLDFCKQLFEHFETQTEQISILKQARR